jgi:hypothetical protein
MAVIPFAPDPDVCPGEIIGGKNIKPNRSNAPTLRIIIELLG